MKGFYLYCIREKRRDKFSQEGINNAPIFTVPYQDLEAVVSKVSLDEFNSEEIQKRAQEDLGWIKTKAIYHQNAIGEAMGLRAPALSSGENPLINKDLKVVIPMKFGTIFKTKENLEETLEKYYSQFKENLKNLAGKQEWTVKVYLNRKVFEAEIKKISPLIGKKEKEIASLPKGIAYFKEKEIEEAVSKEAEKALPNYTDRFFEILKKYAQTETKGKILEKELTGQQFPMILNGIFLVVEEKLEDFLKEIDKLNKKYEAKGFKFAYGGPLPPYNFI